MPKSKPRKKNGKPVRSSSGHVHRKQEPAPASWRPRNHLRDLHEDMRRVEVAEAEMFMKIMGIEEDTGEEDES